MSKPLSVKVRTQAEVKAEAKLLDGSPSRVALAAVGDGDEVAPVESGKVGELWLYGVVGGWWRGFNAESVAEALRGMDVEHLYVRIHSPGGYASDGVAIGNLLRNYNAKVTVVVDGLAASAASVIAVAGDEIVMCPGSQMMLHDASTWESGNAGDHRKIADWLDGQSDNYAGVYAYKAGGTAKKWREVMLANDGWGTWYTAEAAVAASLATEVGTRTATGSPPTAPDDGFDDDDLYAKVAHDLELLDRFVHPAARAAWLGDTPPKPPSASAVGSTHTEGGPAVAFSDEQLTTMRQKLGLPENADEATIVAALDEALEEGTEAATASTTTPEVQEGMSLIDNDTLAELRAGAEDGRTARQQQRDADRDRTINAAMQAGKFPKARREHYVTAWNGDPEGTRTLLDSMAAGLVPVDERGSGEEAAETPQAVNEDPRYKNWKV